MANFEWSETFISVEGEAQYVGHPTVYIRFARCNFKCPRFNNTTETLADTGYAKLEYDPSIIKSIDELQPNEHGCDSQYAVNPAFKHIWHTGDADVLVNEVVELLPGTKWTNPITQTSTILSLTGGEPTLRLKNWGDILSHVKMKSLTHLLIETNCAVPMRERDLLMLANWIKVGIDNGIERIITWSNSPKLSNSGELWEKAINPIVALQQRSINDQVLYLLGMNGYRKSDYIFSINQYFKFVCDDSDAAFDEVAKAMDEYHKAGIPINTPVYIMPESCVVAQQDNIAKNVALKCIERGYILCYRTHLSLFGNEIGT